MGKKVEYIIWHCSASNFGSLLWLDKIHRDKGWSSCGYHSVILNGYLTSNDYKLNRRISYIDGLIQIGRVFDGDNLIQENENGAHAYGFNGDSLGLCMIGDVGKDNIFRPTIKQWESALKITKYWMKQFDVSGSNIIGHREIGNIRPQFATSKLCPGFDMQPVRDIFTSIDIDNAIRNFLDKKWVEHGNNGKL